MSQKIHPDVALADRETTFTVVPFCEHFAPPTAAGDIDKQKKFMTKSLQFQSQYAEELGSEIAPFDCTFDNEDGAPLGRYEEFANLCVEVINSDANKFNQVGTRVIDVTRPYWKEVLRIMVEGAGQRLCYINFPKTRGLKDFKLMCDYLEEVKAKAGITRRIPIHIINETVETHSELRQIVEYNLELKADKSRSYMSVIDFGIMDWVSDHGTYPLNRMRSPHQFSDQSMLVAKVEHERWCNYAGIVPAHNVTQSLEAPQEKYVYPSLLSLKKIKGYDMSTGQAYKDAVVAKEGFKFQRMWSIYTHHIPQILEAFAPDFSQLQVSTEILTKAQDGDWAAIAYDGKLEDRASFRGHWAILKKAKKLGLQIPEEADKRFFTQS